MGGESNTNTSGALAARVHLEMFRCEPYKCRLTRKACAQRYATANAGLGDHGFNLCVGCDVGAEHARLVSPSAAAHATTKRRRGGARTQAAIERAQARKATTSAPPATAPVPTPTTVAEHAVEHDAPPTSAAPQKRAEEPAREVGGERSRRWCSDDEAAPSPARRRGAPVPPAGAVADAWRTELQRDPEELARVIDLLSSRLPSSGMRALQGRAAILRRVAGLTLPEIVTTLREQHGADESLGEELAANWAHRGCAILDEELRQASLFGEPTELGALAPIIRELVGAHRSDAGLPRSAARGPRKSGAPDDALSLFDGIEGAA